MPRQPIPRAAKDPERQKKLLAAKNLPVTSGKKRIPKQSNVKGLKTHPSYLKMILKAIVLGNNHHRGESLRSIISFMARNYPLSKNYQRFVRKALQSALDEGILVKGSSSQRYRINTKQKAKLKRLFRFKKRGRTTKRHKTSKKRGESAASTPRSEEKKNKKRSKGTRVHSGNTVPDEPANEESSGKLVWAWQYWDNGWYNYDKEASNLVEATYQEYLKNPGITDVRSVKSGQWTYQVDFRQMTQINIEHENHTSRKIRRYRIPESDFGLGKKRYN
jgi:hypothetical protein